MLMMRALAVRIMKSRPRAEAASSNLLALHRAVQKPTPTPHGTRARFAAIHQLISSFRVRAGDPAGARITSISRTPRDAAEEGRRQWRACLKGFAFTASPSSGGPRPQQQKGPAALSDLRADAAAADRKRCRHQHSASWKRVCNSCYAARRCNRCNQLRAQSEFSQRQWSRSAGFCRRCAWAKHEHKENRGAKRLSFARARAFISHASLERNCACRL